MTARRRPRPVLPDPYDPANDTWWRAYDHLDTIAQDAARIAAAARAAHARFRAGCDPQLDSLIEALDRWAWDRGSLDVVGEHAGDVDDPRRARLDVGTDR